MTWLELTVECEPEAVESVSELLSQHGYNSGVVVDQPIIPGRDGPEYTFDATRPVTVRTYLALDERAEEARARVEQGLWFLGMMRQVGALLVTPIAEEDWANAWKRYYTVQRIGRRSVVVPSWQEYQPKPDDIVLKLDPGMAFGTGLHPTTRLCVALLEQYVTPGASTLDLGCGSGILAVAAVLLGARPVLALDTDPIAVTATQQNAALNGVADQITVAEGSLGAGARFGHWLYGTPNAEGRTLNEAAGPALPTQASTPEIVTSTSAFSVQRSAFDLIVANIIAKVHVALAQDYVDSIAPGGTLIVSGIIVEKEPDVVQAFAGAGLVPLERRQEGDWVALVYRRP
jgi:ribosomal protein L11 methyltransferase